MTQWTISQRNVLINNLGIRGIRVKPNYESFADRFLQIRSEGLKTHYGVDMRATKLRIALLSLALTIGVGIVSVGIAAQGPTKPLPYRFLIPEGYVGWIRADFDVEGAPTLPVEDGFYILKFNESGRLKTSLGDLLESRRDEFFFYSNEGKYRLHEGGPVEQRLIQDQFSGPGRNHVKPVPNHYRYIFVGPKTVFDRYQAGDKSIEPREADGYPKVGARSWLTREDLIGLKVRQP